MKARWLIWVLVLAQGIAGISAAAQQVDILDALVNGKTAQSFTGEKVAEGDLNTILLSGVNAQSAMNSQPWHFSVITDEAFLTELGGAGGPGGAQPPAGGASQAGQQPPTGTAGQPSLADGAGQSAQQPPSDSAGQSVSGASGQARPGGKRVTMADAAAAIVVSTGDSLKWNSFDAGGACDRMSVAALALGYATRIVAGPCDTINASADYRASCGIPDDMNAIAVLLIGKADAADATASASVRNDFNDVVTFVKGD